MNQDEKTYIYENKNIERGATCMNETKSSAKTWTGGHTFIELIHKE